MILTMIIDAVGAEKVGAAALYIVFFSIACAVMAFVIFIIYNLLRSYSIKNLEYKRYFSEKGAFEGQEIYLIEEFTNHSILPMFKVYVETHITTKLNLPGCTGGNEINQEFMSRFFVMPYTRIKRKHKVICMQRGFYKLESAKLLTMRMELYRPSVAEIMVYPKELSIQDINKINNCIQLSSVSRRPLIRDVFSFAKVREYHPGDGMNSINHKATARTGRLMVNERDFVLGRRILLYLNFQQGDTGISVDDFGDIMELSMEYVSHIAGEALKHGWQIGLSANCRMTAGDYFLRISTGTGYVKYMEILENLAKIRTTFGNSIGYVMNMDIEELITGTEIFLFTTYVDESIESRMEYLERVGNIVNVVNLREVAAYEG